jgi:prolipoprotein diacylglyceryltransferase
VSRRVRRALAVVYLAAAGALLGLYVVALCTVRFAPEDYQPDPVGFAVTVVAVAVGWLVLAVLLAYAGLSVWWKGDR